MLKTRETRVEERKEEKRSEKRDRILRACCGSHLFRQGLSCGEHE